MTQIIKTENLYFTYGVGTPFEFEALRNINISINKGELAGIIGPTGSGKSTLIQHFNGLLTPTSGRVLIDGRDINKRNKEKKKKVKDTDMDRPVCFDVGLVFQYPEYQLFEETVCEDISFGPNNMELSSEEIDKRVREAMSWMNLDYDKFRDRSPFSLSGGEMRRVALAGVLAMRPKVLVLDEPTAGLDPRGCNELRELILRFHRESDITLVMVTHEMGEIAKMVDHLIVINNGEVAADGKPGDIFRKQEWIRELGLGVPPYMQLMHRLRKRGIDVREDVLDVEDAVKVIREKLLKKTTSNQPL